MTNLPDNPDYFPEENGDVESIFGEVITRDELQQRMLARRDPEPREDA